METYHNVCMVRGDTTQNDAQKELLGALESSHPAADSWTHHVLVEMLSREYLLDLLTDTQDGNTNTIRH